MSFPVATTNANNIVVIMWQWLLLVLVLILITTTTTITAHIKLDDEPAVWYTKYSKYPDYCTTEEMIKQHQIPLPKEDKRVGETRIVHVASIIRHGSRTPIKSLDEINCWDGYLTNQETSKWDCDLTTMMAPPNPEHIKQEEGMDRIEGSDAVALFEKHYDGLQGISNVYNKLHGTCQIGQLILQGYEQSYQNGQFLRSAYCYDGNSYDHDLRMRLLDISGQQYQPWSNPNFYFRSDDEQRTLLSGQAVIRGMLEKEIENMENQGKHVIIPVHTADKDQDILNANEKICPKLIEIRTHVEKSRIFKSFNQSNEAKEIRKFMKYELKTQQHGHEMDILECLMPVICTDKQLPDVLQYEETINNDKNWFNRMVNFVSIINKKNNF